MSSWKKFKCTYALLFQCYIIAIVESSQVTLYIQYNLFIFFYVLSGFF